METNKFLNLLIRLTGQSMPIEDDPIEYDEIFSDGGIGYNQLNEILLMYGYDRISPSFFKFLVLAGNQDNEESEDGNDIDNAYHTYLIASIEEFENIVETFNIIALIAFGNIKFAFKTLATSKEQVKYCYSIFNTKEKNFYLKRKPPIKSIKPIPEDETYYLGYLIQKKIRDNANNVGDPNWLREKGKMEKIIEKGIFNNNTYLVSDYMDVYVATSMREKHEFVLTYNFIQNLFNHKEVKPLNLRYFDPTQAFCHDRIDKGLTEALMLKVSACTIYQVQEKDTFGKDSELASTLAQGKTVIAYVPIGDKVYADNLLKIMSKLDSEKTEKHIILDYLRIFEPEIAWGNKCADLRLWIESPDKANIVELKDIFYNTVSEIYEKRANNLSKNHPLGIQIDLKTGVACGVLVARTIEECAKLLKRVILNELTFNLDPKPDEENLSLPIGEKAIMLREEITNSIYRIMTKDPLLTNTFWNQYNDNFK